MKKWIGISVVLLLTGCSWVTWVLKKTEKYTESHYLDDLNEKLDSLIVKVEGVSADMDTLLMSLSPDSIKTLKNKTEAENKLKSLESEALDIFKRIDESLKYAKDLSKEYVERMKKAPEEDEFKGPEGKLKLAGLVKDISDSLKKIDELVKELKNMKDKRDEIMDIFKKYRELIREL